MRGVVVSGLVAATVLVAGAGLGTSAVLKHRHNEQAQQRCERIAAAVAARGDAPVSYGDRTVVVLGDSYSQGTALDRPRESWPTWFGRELEATVLVNGFAGSGFTRHSHCGRTAYADRLAAVLALRPALVVIQGGLNDTRASSPQIRQNVRAVLAGLADVNVVLVGPPAAPARSIAEVVRVDAALAAAAAEASVTYVSTLTWDLHYVGDDLHLTAAGHRRFGEQVAAAMAD